RKAAGIAAAPAIGGRRRGGGFFLHLKAGVGGGGPRASRGPFHILQLRRGQGHGQDAHRGGPSRIAAADNKNRRAGSSRRRKHRAYGRQALHRGWQATE